MRYLRSFQLSSEQVKNPNIYPYNSLKKLSGEFLLFDSITILYGNNGSGKSTLLNLIASKLGIKGGEPPKKWGKLDYFETYVSESIASFEVSEENGKDYKLPENSRYIKSEDILYEIKKIQQEGILEEGYLYERKQLGMTKAQLLAHKDSFKMRDQIEKRLFSQEKYSNGETGMQIFADYLEPNGLYLLDEPEVSLSPSNQLKLTAMINEAARYLNCQFIIASHSPFILGELEGQIYNLDQKRLEACRWTELENMARYYQFFAKHAHEFDPGEKFGNKKTETRER